MSRDSCHRLQRMQIKWVRSGHLWPLGSLFAYHRSPAAGLLARCWDSANCQESLRTGRLEPECEGGAELAPTPPSLLASMWRKRVGITSPSHIALRVDPSRRAISPLCLSLSLRPPPPFHAQACE